MAKPEVITVLGMDRSGTSLLTHVLGLLGMDFSSALVPPREDNRKGFFEDAVIVDIQMQLLTGYGREGVLTSCFPMPQGWQRSHEAIVAGQKLKEHAELNIRRALQKWGFKDPRTARLLPLWEQVFKSLDAKPRYVLSMRHPLAVAQSLQRRENRPISHGLCRWTVHNLEMLINTKAEGYIVHYEDWFQDALGTAQRLAKGLGLKTPLSRKELAAKLTDIVDPAMRNNVSDGEITVAVARELYELLKNLRGYDSDRRALLRRAEEMYDGILGALPLQETLEASTAQLAECLAARDKYWKEKKWLEGNAGTLSAGKTKAEQERDACLEERRKAELQYLDERTQFVLAGEELKAVASEKQQLEESLRKCVSRGAELDASLAATTARAQKAEEQLVDRTSELKHLQQQYASAHEAARAEAQMYAQLINQAEGLARTQQTELSALSASLEQARQSLVEKLRQAERLEEALAANRVEINELGRQLEDARIYRSGLPKLLLPPSPELLEPPDLEFIAAHAPQDFRPLKICILTQDIFGPIRNGGIGTAFGHVADFLAGLGHDVTILYTLGQHCEQGDIATWVEHYAKKNIKFVSAPDCQIPNVSGRMNNMLVVARRAYEALRDMESFDLVHVSEWSGNAYFALQAKRLGLAFADTIFAVKTSSPHLWDYEGNNKPLTSIEMLTTSHMEQRSVEWADLVISPSRHMLRWMSEHGYDLPKGRLIVNPNIMPLPNNWQEVQKRPMRLDAVNELVFFGRLDKRKGIDIFADALSLLQKDSMLPPGVTVTFLGKRSPLFDSERAIEEWSQAWGVPVRTVLGLNAAEAIEYLKGEGRLAIVPSRLDNSPFTIYECLAHRIAFLTTDRGGTPELVLAEDHDRVIFAPQPKVLAGLIARALAEGMPVGRASFDLEANLDRWARFHLALAHDKSIVPASCPRIEGVCPENPLVSVCIAHYNRPDMLPQALDSIRCQTYPNVEVVVVDDGSTKPDAQAYLASLKDEFASRNWQIVYQENKYLGAVRNTSARYARGEYLLLMDDDNVAKPHEVETFVRCAQHSRADILTCFGDVLATLDAPGPDYVAPARTTFLGNNLSLGIVVNCFGDSNALIRRGVIEEVGGFTEDYGVSNDDHEFFARAVLCGKQLEVIPEALYWYRTVGTRMLESNEKYPGNYRALKAYFSQLPSGLHQAFRLLLGLYFKDDGARPVLNNFQQLAENFKLIEKMLGMSGGKQL